jgi:hypothetical protein
MPASLELSLTHDGQSWCTDSLKTKVHGKDLRALEDSIINTIKIDPRFNNEKSLQVELRFDMDTLPRWLHQYHAHYFNYTFTVTR